MDTKTLSIRSKTSTIEEAMEKVKAAVTKIEDLDLNGVNVHRNYRYEAQKSIPDGYSVSLSYSNRKAEIIDDGCYD